MKRHGDLWRHVIAPENIELAYQRAKKGKSWQRTIQEVEKNKDSVLRDVRQSLVDRTFTTAEYRTLEVWEPKHRLIYVLPFNPDRIVQHAVMAVVAPVWDGMFDTASHACRPGYGQHSASRKASEYVRKYQYVLHADIRKFYPSINQELAMRVIEKKIKDQNVLWLLGDIVRSFPGERNVPIGNLTSQWLGNLYMNELDMFVRHTLKPRGYLRYNDDFLLFGNDKRELRSWQESCRSFLRERLDLTMAKERIYPTTCGVDFVGYRHFPGKVLVRKRTARRIRDRISRLRYEITTKQIPMDRARCVVASTRGWLRWAQSHNFARSLKLDQLQEEIVAAIQ